MKTDNVNPTTEAGIQQYIQDIPDDVLTRIVENASFSVPWQYDQEEDTYKDPDFGVRRKTAPDSGYGYTRERLQEESWQKFQKNPQVNTAIRRLVGRIAGWGWQTISEQWEIQEIIDEITDDPRNRLYNWWPKFLGRHFVEGELFLVLSVHTDGFIEVDFLDPSCISEGGDDGSGIIFHPTKTSMPLFYNISASNAGITEQIPSIFIAHYPELVSTVKKHKDYNRSLQQPARSRKHVYKPLGGYRKFVVAWDKGLVTKRAVSYLRTILEWLNRYENLKKYEIDHKKSSGSYLWVVKMEDPRMFKLWLALSDDDRRKTGIMAKKTPGGTLVMPPGMTIEATAPELPKISEQDTDILEMVYSGLNETPDVVSGTPKGTYATLRATRGPMSDRDSDEIAYFDRFYRLDFWGAILYLKHVVAEFPRFFEIMKVVGFEAPDTTGGEKEPKPIWKKIKKKAEKLVHVIYPASEMTDYETKAKGMLGTKHGPLSETVGVPHSEILRRMGFGGHGWLRMQKAEEDAKYPKLVYTQDAESIQEKKENNPSGESGSSEEE